MKRVPTGPARAGMALSWPAGPVAITWSLDPDEAGRAPAWSRPPATSGELLVADLHATDPGQLEIADAICCPARHSGDLPGSALRQVLERYPGCAVAATRSGPHECRVSTRGSPAVTLTVRMRCWGSLLQPVLAACFVHGWMAAGRPAAVLDSGRLIVSPLAAAARAVEPGDRDPGTSLEHVFSYSFCDFPPARMSSSSRCWVASASAAPAAE